MVKSSKISQKEKDSGWANIRIRTETKEKLMKQLEDKQSFNSLLQIKLKKKKR